MNTLKDLPQVSESPRAFSSAMAELATAIGDLETAARALAGRISPLLPAGDPYNRIGKDGAQTSPPKPVRSPLCDEVHSRTWSIRAITERLEEMVKSVEI